MKIHWFSVANHSGFLTWQVNQCLWRSVSDRQDTSSETGSKTGSRSKRTSGPLEMETLGHRENSSKPVPEPPDFASGGVSGPLLNHFLCVFGTTNGTFLSFLQGSPPWILENPVAKRVTFSTISSGKWTSDPDPDRNRGRPSRTVPGDQSRVSPEPLRTTGNGPRGPFRRWFWRGFGSIFQPFPLGMANPPETPLLDQKSLKK